MSMTDETQERQIQSVANPFGEHREPAAREAATEVAVQRELAEVQGAVLMARRFPRSPIQAMDRILQACTRLSLAQTALYSYSRGGTEITGPSIRLAEVLAQNWGNMSFGMREVEQRAFAGRPGESTMISYCWDLESNVRDERVFQVKHERHTKSGSSRLTDPRDIYETTANQGARRLRACILAVIPGDVVERAVEQCEATLLAKADTSPEAVGKLVKAFEQFGVTREQIEQRIQRRIDTIRPAQIVQLRKTWASLNDGMSVASDWFQAKPPEEGEPEPEAKGSEGLKQKLRPQGGVRAAAPGKPTSDSATPASPASPDPTASGPQPPGEPSSDGELPLREPGEEG